MVGKLREVLAALKPSPKQLKSLNSHRLPTSSTLARLSPAIFKLRFTCAKHKPKKETIAKNASLSLAEWLPTLKPWSNRGKLCRCSNKKQASGIMASRMVNKWEGSLSQTTTWLCRILTPTLAPSPRATPSLVWDKSKTARKTSGSLPPKSMIWNSRETKTSTTSKFSKLSCKSWSRHSKSTKKVWVRNRSHRFSLKTCQVWLPWLSSPIWSTQKCSWLKSKESKDSYSKR